MYINSGNCFGAKLRSCPDEKSKVLAVVPHGELVHAVSENYFWYKVKWKNLEGFMTKKFLTVYNPCRVLLNGQSENKQNSLMSKLVSINENKELNSHPYWRELKMNNRFIEEIAYSKFLDRFKEFLAKRKQLNFRERNFYRKK